MHILTKQTEKCFINFNNSDPGILAIFGQDPIAGKIYSELAEHLLRSEHPTLSPFFRELVASLVSKVNKCNFCFNSHIAITYANSKTASEREIIKEVLLDDNYSSLPIHQKYLLHYAENIARNIQPDPIYISYILDTGGTEKEIFRVAQIAAAFAMYNRLVDGLGTPLGTIEDKAMAGSLIAERGYVKPFVQEV